MSLIAQTDFTQGLEAAWTRIAVFVPKLLGFLAIVIIGYFIARAIEKILDRVLERVGFDRVVERGGVKSALERTQYDASDILARVVFYAVFLFALQLAFGLFGPNPVSELLEGLIAFLPRIFAAILIVALTGFVANGVREIIRASIGGLNYGRIVATLAAVGIWVIGIAAALNQVQVAPAVVNGILYALLALVVGVGIVAIGGGGVMPMRDRWDRALRRMDQEAPAIKKEAQSSSTDRVDIPEEAGSRRQAAGRRSR